MSILPDGSSPGDDRSDENTNQKPATDNFATLLPHHLAELRSSGLSDEQVRRCNFRSESDPAVWSKYLKWPLPPKNGGPVLCIPFYTADGKCMEYVRVKPDKPREQKKGKLIKYESPIEEANRAYFPPATRGVLADPTKPILVTEGEKKAAKADQEGFPCVGLVGVYGWNKPRSNDKVSKGDGSWELIADLADVPWKDRSVVIAFDSDITGKPEVQWAERKLAETLARADAKVFFVRIPPTKDGGKQGLDDFLIVAGREGLNDLIAHATSFQNPADQRPEILIDHEEHRVIGEAVDAISPDWRIYQRGGMLVHVVETEAGHEGVMVRRPPGAAVIREFPPALLRETITRRARLKKILGYGENAMLVPAHPTTWLVTGVHQQSEFAHVRHLTGVVTHPVILADGTLLTEPGYHLRSRLFVCPPAGLTLTVLENPGPDDVKAALVVLFDPLVDFPFETPAHRSAWLAGLLTPLAWFAFDGPAPLFLIDGNVCGVGKGLLADVIALIVTGRRFATMAYTDDREELRKKITSLAVEGERMVLLDNLAGNVGNDVLDNALTSCQWKDRLLGGNRNFDGPLNLTWYGTGNNVQFRADTSRRVCHVRLETADERPETKSDFRYPNLRDHVRCHRGALLSAALTVLRAWYVAGKPSQNLSAWGSFEGWSMVRDVIVFAGLPDPGETREAMQSNADHDAAAMKPILVGMSHLDDQGRGLTAADIIGRLKELPNSPPEYLTDMRSAVEELCGRLDGRSLAYKLRSFKHRNFAGLRLVEASKTNGSVRWSAQRVGAPPATSPKGDAGDPGDVSARPASPRKIQLPPDWQSQMLPD